MPTSHFETVDSVTMNRVVEALMTHGGWASARTLLPLVMKLARMSIMNEYEQDRVREKIRRVCQKKHPNIESKKWGNPHLFRYRSGREIELKAIVQRVRSELKEIVEDTVIDLGVQNAKVDRYGSVTIQGVDFLSLVAKLL